MPEGTVALRTLVLVILVGLSVSAGTSARIIRVPADSTSIQSGIRGVQDGDTVLVAPGTYIENINFLGKAILVTSEAGAESTIVDGSAPAHPDSGSAVYFISGEDSNSILSGFTITGGSGTFMEVSRSRWYYYGGGILCAGGSAPVISENIVTGNVSRWGGGIGCHHSGAKVIRNVIEHNEAELYGGGLHCYQANATIEGNVIGDNSSGAYGGGLECLRDRSSLIGNTITGNTAAFGAGIEGYYFDGLIQDNYIVYNHGSQWGAGISSEEGEPTIRENIIVGNSAPVLGGGIYAHRGLIEGNDISCNIAGDGGAICTLFGGPTIVGNTIRGNSALAVGGGGISAEGHTSDPTIVVNNLIVENSSASQGGGIMGGPALVVNNTISHNDAPYGAGVFCWVSTNPEFLVISNNVISSNSGGYGIYNDSTYAYCVPDIYYNDVWDNGINYYGCLPGHNDISVDPEFAQPDWGHYSLLASSPCLDVGDPFFLDPDGTRSNMGAFGGPDAKLVHLTVVPEADTVAGGGMLTYEAILSNNFVDPLTTFGLTELLMPSGFPSPLNPLLGPMRVSLGPYQTVHKTISHYVPPAAPEGEYWHTGKVGFPPDVLEDLEAFSFQVVE